MKKKRLFSLLLAAVMVLSLTPATAFAASGVSGETVVSYTVGSSYEINIPASINLNNYEALTITASSMNTSWGQRVSVFIDGARTYENNGNFYLYKNKGTASEEKITCDLRLGSSVVNGVDAEVGRFDDGSTTNSAGNTLDITPLTGSASPGTYTGVMYFRITMS